MELKRLHRNANFLIRFLRQVAKDFRIYHRLNFDHRKEKQGKNLLIVAHRLDTKFESTGGLSF